MLSFLSFFVFLLSPLIVAAQSAPAGSASTAAAQQKPAGSTTTKNQLSRDIAAIRSWSFLKRSMEALGTNTQKVVQVREDLKAMEQDIKNQQQYWDGAKATLIQENNVLTENVKNLESKLVSDAKWLPALAQATAQAEEGRRRAEFLENQVKLQASSWEAERALLMQRREQVEKMQKQNYELGGKKTQTLLIEEQQTLVREKQTELALQQADLTRFFYNQTRFFFIFLVHFEGFFGFF